MKTILIPACSYNSISVDNFPEKLAETSDDDPDVALAFSGPVPPSTKELEGISSANAQLGECISFKHIHVHIITCMHYIDSK